MENFLFILCIAIMVQLVLPALIIEMGDFIASIDDLFDGKERRRKKASKIFNKKFKDMSFSKISRMRDAHFGEHMNDEKFERLSISEFAVRYIDPKTMDYNDIYRLEWNK